MLPVYHCWIAVLTHLGGAGYAKSVRRCQNCPLDTKRWCQSCKVQRSKILLVKRIDLSIYLKTTQRKSQLRCRLQRQARFLSIHQDLESYPLAYPQSNVLRPLWRGEWLISLAQSVIRGLKTKKFYKTNGGLWRIHARLRFYFRKCSDFGASTAVSALFSCAHTCNLYIKIKTERKNSQRGRWPSLEHLYNSRLSFFILIQNKNALFFCFTL